jgi:hypothetical protein
MQSVRLHLRVHLTPPKTPVTYNTETGRYISETVNTISESVNIKHISETFMLRKPLKHQKQQEFMGTHILGLRAVRHGYYTRKPYVCSQPPN